MPTETATTPKSQHNSWSFVPDIIQMIILVWKTQPVYTLLILILSIVQGFIPAVQIWISKLLFDTLATTIVGNTTSTSGSLIRLMTLIGVQAGLFLLSSLFSSSQDTVRTLLGELVSNQVNLKILIKTNGLGVPFFENEQFYNQLQNAYQEAGGRPLEIISQLFSIVQTAITLSSMILILIRLHWAILLLIVISMLPTLIVQNHYGARNFWMLRARAPELRKQQYFGMVLTNNWFIKEIRVFGLEEHFLNLYKSLFAKFFKENRNLIVKRNASSLLASAGYLVGWFLASAYVVIRVAVHAITIGDFALYTQAISSTQGQIQSLLFGLSGLYSNSLFLRNLFEFLSLPSRDFSQGKKWTEPINEIEFRNVSFNYPGTNRTVLNDVNFKIYKGQTLALVGKNGAGKTTIVKLLCRLYEPAAGSILINGKNIEDFSPKSIQEQIAVLFQDYGQYYLKARENIGIGSKSDLNNLSVIQTAAKRSGANTFIENLPDKYETMLGKWFDEGVELSTGEWQKVALARGLIREGGILILDEPTASLDAEAEYKIYNNLTKNTTDQITILISHRFSTVRMAANILVLEDGKCIETGSHDELMLNDRQYAYLFRLQARGYENGEPAKVTTPK